MRRSTKLFVALGAVLLALLLLTRLSFGAVVPAFDIAATGETACGGIELRVWAIQSDMPGISLDPNGPLGVDVSYHSFLCSVSGPEAVFHVEPSTDIVGLCVSQPECSEECADLFVGYVPGSERP
jgi:hypothetical protein